MKLLQSKIILLCFLITAVYSWSGNTCSRTYPTYYSYSYCRIWGWWGCLYYGYITRVLYKVYKFCCPGWRHDGNKVCNVPICNPSCQNGGTCVQPNKCECADGFYGSVCDKRRKMPS